MERFTNPNILKEKKRLTRNVLLSILLLIVAIALAAFGYYMVEQAKANTKPLNDIIVEQDGGKEEQIATIDVHTKPYLFAEETDSTYAYFIVTDDEFMYIAYMGKYNELTSKTDLKENPVTITGGTKLIPKEIKEYALEAYNQGLEEEEKLTMADFNSYFGAVYLDISATGMDDIGFIPYFCAFVCGLLGLILFATAITQKIKFSSNIKKMDEATIETLDNEMNSSEAFYYERIHLFLTNRYVINFKGSFRVIEYQDIIWMYSMIYRTNGIKTNQSIKVMTKDGKTHEIAAIDIATKAKKEMYEEIWNTIIAKNNHIVLGFTKEAQQEAKERIER